MVSSQSLQPLLSSTCRHDFLLFPLCFVGGAGGKGTWGPLVEMYDDDGHTHDSKDPNYNSEDEEVSGRTLSVSNAILVANVLSV